MSHHTGYAPRKPLLAGASSATTRGWRGGWKSILDARPVGIADFPIQGVSHGLSMQVLPCQTATIRLGDTIVPGTPLITWDAGRPVSSAVTTIHEVWSG